MSSCKHKWEISLGTWKGLEPKLTIQIKHCSKCGCYDFQWTDPEEQCPACGVKFKSIKGLRRNPKILLLLNKWEYPVCNNCASSFLEQCVKEAFTKNLAGKSV